MNRRGYLSALGTTVVCGAGLAFAYGVSQGSIDLPGESADISTDVSGGSETFEFEVADGEDIYITLTDRTDSRRGRFQLYDPTDTEVLDGQLRSSEMTNEVHTAEQGGTYRLVVDSRGGDVGVSVLIQEPEE